MVKPLKIALSYFGKEVYNACVWKIMFPLKL